MKVRFLSPFSQENKYDLCPIPIHANWGAYENHEKDENLKWIIHVVVGFSKILVHNEPYDEDTVMRDNILEAREKLEFVSNKRKSGGL